MRILGVLSGLIAGVATIFALQSISQNLYPPPPGMDMNDPEAVKVMMRDMPVGALLLVILSYAAGSFVGGLVASLVTKRVSLSPALITGALLMAFGIINMLAIPHPVWFWVTSLFVYLPFAYLGFRILVKNRERV